MSKPKTDRIDDFMEALNRYINAKIHERIGRHEQDYLGSFREEKELKQALGDLLK